ncbi:leucine-rich repeat protein, partial [Brochothrix thermosphacta]
SVVTKTLYKQLWRCINSMCNENTYNEKFCISSFSNKNNKVYVIVRILEKITFQEFIGALDSIIDKGTNSIKHLTIEGPNSFSISNNVLNYPCWNSLEILITSDITNIPPYAFNNAKKLHLIQLQNVKEIGAWSFANTLSLELVKLTNLKKIHPQAFKNSHYYFS